MIANETTLHKRPNETEINNYRLPYMPSTTKKAHTA